MESSTPGNVIQPTPAGPPDNEPQASPAAQPVAQPPVSAPIVSQPAAPVSPASQPTTTPASGNGPVVASPSVAPGTNNAQKGGQRKLFFAAAVAAFVVLAGGASAYFGYFLPNQPENIWKTALRNTSKGYDKLIEEGEQFEAEKGFKAEGTYRVETPDTVVDGSFSAQNDEKNGRASVDVGFSGHRITLDVLTSIPENSAFPDVYLKAKGLEALTSMAGPEFGSFAAQLDDQWYSIDHTLFDQMMLTGEDAAETPVLTEADYLAIARAVGDVNRDYLFTTDESKAVLRVAEQVGKEEMDGRSVYRFRVGLHKDNAKAYWTALRDKLKTTKLQQLAGERDLDDFLQFEDVMESLDKIQEADQADVWVDMGTKLIRTVRLTQKNNEKNYVDIGLKYTGGDDFPFYYSFNFDDDGDTGTAQLTFNLNFKQKQLQIEGALDMTSDGQAYKGSLNGTVTSSNETVDIEKPADAKSIMELFGGLFGGIPYGDDALDGPGMQQTVPFGSTDFDTDFDIDTDF